MGAVNKDTVLGASLVLSVASLVLLFGVTWYFHSSLSLLQVQVENDRELLLELKSQVKVRSCFDYKLQAVCTIILCLVCVFCNSVL